MTEQDGKVTQEKGWAVDKGKGREQNEDSVAAVDMSIVDGDAEKSAGIYVVADGVGGEEHGEVASSLAVHTFVNNVIQHLTSSSLAIDDDYQSWLQNAVQVANQTIYGDSKAMGTTLVATLVIGNTAYIANVGDSRAYVLTGNGMQQITEDQSLVQVLLRAGAIDAEQAENHPYRNVLSQAIGSSDEVEPDLYTVDIENDNYLLLCSDGLTNEVDERTIYDTILRSESPQTACADLVAKANQHGGKDNISVVIVKLTSASQ